MACCPLLTSSMSDEELEQYERRLLAKFPELMDELLGQTEDAGAAVAAS
jgi:hypothetical protein